ncbi:MAG: hypothetical protein E7183_05090 [Erysipelotrichaceae bacterium]|nr:hypothetical protein [Erysipelotrichaceae bacterium]
MKIFKFICLFASISLFSLNFLNCKKCDHNFEIIEQLDATCTKSGYQKQKCSLCDKEKTIPLLSSGHNYNEYVIIEEGNCITDGIKTRECLMCHFVDTVKFKNIVHDYEIEIIAPTCTCDGYVLKTCKLCGEINEEKQGTALGHSFNDWVIKINPTSINDGLEIRNCGICGHEETKILPSISYIDLNVIRGNIDVNKVITCKTLDELQLVFDTAILNNVVRIEVDVQIQDFDFDNILTKLVDDCSIESAYKIQASYLKTLVINLEYKEVATTPASNTDAYTQYNSANYTSYASLRNDDFNNFNIYQSMYSYNVSTSDQLFYVLERGVLPILEKNSSAEKIFELAKDVLRDIIDDNMTDFEKVKAIHDYLILNVTYDNELLNLTYQNPSNVSKYNGFYLEGVFLDKRAVCEGISKAFSVLCNIEGIPCVQVIGYQTNNPNGLGHAWNKVYLDGNWYIVDATSDGIIVNNSFEVLSYQYFLITEEKMNEKYTGSMRNNIVCEKNYEAYKNIYYSNNDFYIESFDELVEILKYYENLNPKNYTIELKIAFNYGSSIIDDIQNAYNILKLPASFSHIINDDILMIIN